MSDDRTIITVRGDAQRTVDPDRCTLHTRIQTRRSSRADALESLARTQQAMTDALARLGGVIRTATTDRAPLTWAAGSVQAFQEHPQSSLARKGRLVAVLTVSVRVRDFTLLDRVAAVVTGTDDVDVEYVSWDVDDDSPAGREVRAEAVRAALQRGRDYAAALGATISSVEQLADVGLLGDRQEGGWTPQMAAAPAAAMAMRGGGPPEDEPALVLDPQPQRLAAQIEARLVATGVDLSAH